MFEVGIRKEEVVAEGEKEVVKDEVLQTSNLRPSILRKAHYFLIPPSTFNL